MHRNISVVSQSVLATMKSEVSPHQLAWPTKWQQISLFIISSINQGTKLIYTIHISVGRNFAFYGKQTCSVSKEKVTSLCAIIAACINYRIESFISLACFVYNSGFLC